jgi:hypothetical protein
MEARLLKRIHCLEQCTTDELLVLPLAVLQAAEEQRKEEQSGSEAQKRGGKIKP